MYCAMPSAWRACGWALAAGKVSAGTALVSVTCGAGAAGSAPPTLKGRASMPAFCAGLAEICAIGTAGTSRRALSSGLGDVEGAGAAMGGVGEAAGPVASAARGVGSIALASGTAAL